MRLFVKQHRECWIDSRNSRRIIYPRITPSRPYWCLPAAAADTTTLGGERARSWTLELTPEPGWAALPSRAENRALPLSAANRLRSSAVSGGRGRESDTGKIWCIDDGCVKKRKMGG